MTVRQTDSPGPANPVAPGFVQGLAVTLLVGVLLPVAGSVTLTNFAPDWRLNQIPLHSAVEAIGGLTALMLAALLRMRLRIGGERHPDVWIGAGLAAMGILDISHAAVPPGETFVWLHSVATVAGGLGFAGVLVPTAWSGSGRADAAPVVLAAAAVGLSVHAMVAPQSIPGMLTDGEFTWAARGLNLAGGVLFFLAAAWFIAAFRRDRALSSLLFAVHCTLFGAAGVLFELSTLWDGPWWWWHGLRIAAYAVALSYVLLDYRAAQRDILDLNLDLDEANQELEVRVDERTGRLAEVNESLREEMALREKLEDQRWAARLQHAQKLESLGVLAGGIAHDFNNLLVGVMGNAGLVMEELPANSRLRGPVEQIDSAARRAADLTRQMLDYSGKGRFVVERLDMTRLVREMSELVEASISKKAQIRAALSQELPAFEGDETQLRQVIMNLITNASDALGGDAGTIAVRTGLMYATPEELEHAVVGADLIPGEYVFVEVADTGRGMDDATRERMFDPFYTTKVTGRGLGLAATLGIVRGHGGAIFVDSAQGSGTRVRVLLPAAGDSVITTPVPIDDDGDWEARGTILVADDEEVVRGLVAASLERSGFDVLEAADGKECVEIFEQQWDRIALVVLDLTMPRLGGFEALEIMRARDPGVRVLLSSGYDARESVAEFGDQGVVGFLQKPFGPQELIHIVRSVLGDPDADQGDEDTL